MEYLRISSYPSCHFASLPPDQVRGFNTESTHTKCMPKDHRIKALWKNSKWQNLLTVRRCLHGNSGAHPSTPPHHTHHTASSSPHLTAPGKGTQKSRVFTHRAPGCLHKAPREALPELLAGGQVAVLHSAKALARTRLLCWEVKHVLVKFIEDRINLLKQQMKHRGYKK